MGQDVSVGGLSRLQGGDVALGQQQKATNSLQLLTPENLDPGNRKSPPRSHDNKLRLVSRQSSGKWHLKW